MTFIYKILHRTANNNITIINYILNRSYKYESSLEFILIISSKKLFENKNIKTSKFTKVVFCNMKRIETKKNFFEDEDVN
jgi:hypothetical protein